MATDRSLRSRLLRGSALAAAATALAFSAGGAALADEPTGAPPPAGSAKPAPPPVPPAKTPAGLPVTPPDEETSGAGWTQTPAGPLGPADRDLLVKVRQAGLWEMPMGDEAQVRAASPRVKEVGRLIMKDHEVLDARVKKVAAELQVPLPSEANADQQGWMAELRAAEGPAFDQLFADRLRAAHGKVFTVVAAVRSGSRNNLVREFAQEGINAVMRHMTLLESTKLVNFNDLPLAPNPAAAAPPAGNPAPGAGAPAPSTGKAAAAPKPSVRAKPSPAPAEEDPQAGPQDRNVANASNSSWADDAGGGGMILLVLLLCTGLAAATIGVVRFVQSR